MLGRFEKNWNTWYQRYHVVNTRLHWMSNRKPKEIYMDKSLEIQNMIQDKVSVHTYKIGDGLGLITNNKQKIYNSLLSWKEKKKYSNEESTVYSNNPCD